MASQTSAESPGTAVLTVTGMACGGCANTVARVLSRVAGVTGAEVDLKSGRATVSGAARIEDLIEAIEAAGFGVQRS